MLEWLVAGVVGVLVLLLAFVVTAAVLLDRARGERAVKVLRLLLVGTVPAAAGAAVKLHDAGLL